MGAIQPARFLTHTGQIRPGVSRVVKVNNPAVAHDWSVTVPGGVQWRIVTGQATFTPGNNISATSFDMQISINGVNVGLFQCATSITTVSGNPIIVSFSMGLPALTGNDDEDNYIVSLPDVFLPSGATLATVTPGIDAAAQWSKIAMWVQEFYFTDEQLTELEIREESLERAYVQLLVSQSQSDGA